MARNGRFAWNWEPFRDNERLDLREDEVNGVFYFLNPTSGVWSYVGDADQGGEGAGTEAVRDGLESSSIEYKWTSRNNRKGRHSLIVRELLNDRCDYGTPPPTNTYKAIMRGIWRMLTHWSIYDISYLVAITFTIGATVLVVNSIITFLPYASSTISYNKKLTYATAILNFIGCTFFQIGSSLSFLEAVNANRHGCLGWKLENAASRNSGDNARINAPTSRVVPDKSCEHQHSGHARLLGDDPNAFWVQAAQANGETDETADSYNNGRVSYNLSRQQSATGTGERGAQTVSLRQWRYFPTWNELRTHYAYDLGFLTCSLLLTSTIVYYTAATALLITTIRTMEAATWIRIPQLVAATGFFISSILFMLETQRHWWKPAFKVLG